jgi:hypothetical protein
MSLWMLIVIATAFGGALVVWHMVSRTKHVSEEMLIKYGEMLDRAREEKARQIADLTTNGTIIDTQSADEAEVDL